MSTFKLCIKYFAFPREIDELSLSLNRVLQCFRFVGLQEKDRNFDIILDTISSFYYCVFTNLNLTKKNAQKLRGRSSIISENSIAKRFPHEKLPQSIHETRNSFAGEKKVDLNKYYNSNSYFVIRII